MPDPLRSFANFRYVVTPAPVLRTKRTTRFAKDVWSVIYTYERMNLGDELVADVHVSVRQIVSLVGSDRKAVRRALAELVENGMLEKTGRVPSTARMRGATAYATRCPKWLTEDAADLLLAGVRRSVMVSNEGEGGRDAPRGGGGTPPLDQGDKAEEEVTTRATPPRDPVEAHRDPVDAEEGGEEGERSEPASCGEEVEELNVDDESVAASEALEREKEERAERREASRRKVRKLPSDDDPDLLRRPSARDELSGWRSKASDGRNWSARDVIGYFAARFLELRGEETTELHGTIDAILKHYVPNVRKFVERWFDDDYRRAKAAVDKILGRAESLGLPVKLVYFFTPARPAAMNRLDEPVRKRALAPHERNDQRGDYEANKDYWDERARLAESKRAEREASGD
jgi:hypothetical protein